VQVGLAQKAGEPIYNHDIAELNKAIKAQAIATAKAAPEAETITEREAVLV
jgi:hypothetical protein